jgi:mannose-6-phosphate isomerase-like protein (cupin superfamily)
MEPRVVVPSELAWVTRPHAEGEPARHVTELSDVGGMTQARANAWRFEPGAAGRRHRHALQEEVFVVLQGTLSIYLGDPPVRHDVEVGSMVVVPPGTVVQSVNHGDVDLVTYVHGWPGEHENAELLDSAV